MSEPNSFKDVWVEKYRPQTLKDVEGSDGVLNRLRAMVADGNFQHMLVAGPPGTGKTTSVMCMARELLGEEALKHCVKELNASDDRGVEVVRTQIKDFARKYVKGILPEGRHKIVILDEVDSMTNTAQQALRRVMEIYSDTTRFALICNNSTKVIEAIQSRCVIVRFGKLSDEHILKRLLKVCELEKVVHDNAGLETLIFTADGDLRSAINNLQSTAQGFGRVVNKSTVLKVCDIPPPEIIRKVLSLCLDVKWREARQQCILLMEEGYTTSDVIAILKNLIKRGQTTNSQKGLGLREDMALEAITLLTMASMNIDNGDTSFIHLDSVLIRLCQLGVANKA